MADELDLRIGDVDRQSAVDALGEHMSAGRLDMDEYGERTAKVATAKTRRDVLALFTDLPVPGPTFSRPGTTPARTMDGPAAVGQPPAAPPVPHPGGTVGQRLVGALVPLSAMIALVLFLGVVHNWMVFLIPVAVAVIGGALVGGARVGDPNRGHSHELRDRLRDERHERRQLRRGRDDGR